MTSRTVLRQGRSLGGNLCFVASVALGHDTSMVFNCGTKLFPILACRMALSAVPMRLPGNGLVVVAFDAHPLVAFRMLRMLKCDIRPGDAADRDRLGRGRNLGLLAGSLMRNIALGQERKENEKNSNSR